MMDEMGRLPGKAFGAVTILRLTLVLPTINDGAMGFCVPTVMVGSGVGLIRTLDRQGRRRFEEQSLSSLLPPNDAFALRSTTDNNNAPFGHPNDEMREIYVQNPQGNNNNRYNRDDESITARHSFVFPDVPYGRAFAAQGGRDSSAIAVPAITLDETPAVLQDPNDSQLLVSHLAYQDSIQEEEVVAAPATIATTSSHHHAYQAQVLMQKEEEEAGAVVHEESNADLSTVNQDLGNEAHSVVQLAASTSTMDIAATPVPATTNHASPDLKITQDAGAVVQAASTATATTVSSRQDVVSKAGAGSIAAGAISPADAAAAVSDVADDVDLAVVEEIRPPAFAMPEACPPSIAMPEIPTSIKQTLRSPAWKAPLAQIACAYHPGLQVENIRELSVGTVDETHLDVEALVCTLSKEDADCCVTVNVPVDFPTSCFGAEDSCQCILDNIQQLSDLIKAEGESELFPSAKTLLDRERLLKEVVSPRFLEYPNWWSTPVVLAGACNTLRVVLNDAECQPQLQRLFRKNSSKAQKIVRAALVAVGPCGVILRALDTKNQLHEVPIAFAVPATDAGRLRSAVLELFG